MFALDTNTLIYYFKRMGNVAEKLLENQPEDIAVPSVVVFELETGIEKSAYAHQARRQLNEFLEAATILPFGQKEAVAAAKVRAHCERLGTPLGPFDTLIAGTALASHAVLVTHNVKEFMRIKELRCVDWY